MTDRSSLQDACEKGDEGAVRALLAAGASANSRSGYEMRSPLHFALRDGGSAVVELLLAAGADVNAASNDGSTPLHEKCNTGRRRANAIKLLLAAGADVNAVNSRCETPLHRESEGLGEVEVMKLLLEAGANVNAVSSDGETPLHRAARSSNAARAKALLDAGADVNALSKDGSAPLHLASASDYSASVEVVKLLLASGARMGAAKNGATPLFMARKVGCTAGIKLLLAEELRQSGRGGDIQPLVTMLGNGDEDLRNAALDILLEMGADAKTAIKDFFGSDPERWIKDPCARARPNRVCNPELANKEEFKRYRIFDSYKFVEEWASQVAEEPRRGYQYVRMSVSDWNLATRALYDAFKKRFNIESADAVILFDSYLSAICEKCSHNMSGEIVQMSSALGKMANLPARKSCTNCGYSVTYVAWAGDKLHDLFF